MDKLKILDAVIDRMSLAVEQIESITIGISKVMRCPRCGKEITVARVKEFGCECGWPELDPIPKPNGGLQ